MQAVVRAYEAGAGLQEGGGDRGQEGVQFPSVASQTCVPSSPSPPRPPELWNAGSRPPHPPTPLSPHGDPAVSPRPLCAELLFLTKLGFYIFNLLYRIKRLDLLLAPLYNKKYHVAVLQG